MAEEAAAAAAATAALEKAMQSFSFREFDKAKESWEDYVFGFEQMGRAKGLFRQNNDEYSAARRTLLLAMMGSEALKVVRNHFRPDDVNEKTYGNVKAALRNYYAPNVTVFSARIDFMKRNRLEGESFGQYANALRELADRAEYGAAVIDFQLRDQFAAGIRHEKVEIEIRQKWHNGREGGNEVTFEQVFRLAEAVKRAENECAKGRAEESTMVKKLRKAGRQKDDRRPQETRRANEKSDQAESFENCGKCGEEKHHEKSECPAWDRECHKCGKVGQFARMCRGSKYQGRNRRRQKVKRVSEDSDEEVESRSDGSTSGDSYRGSAYKTIRKVGSALKRAVVRVKINGRKLRMAFDTGALQTTIGVDTWNWLGSPVLRPTKQRNVYGGRPIELLGETTVDVEAFGKLRVQKMVVANVTDVPLFGSDWAAAFGYLGRMKKLGIDTKRLDPTATPALPTTTAVSNEVTKLIEEFKPPFSSEGGLIKEHKAVTRLQKGKSIVERSLAEAEIASDIRHLGEQHMDDLPIDSKELKRKTATDPVLAKIIIYMGIKNSLICSLEDIIVEQEAWIFRLQSHSNGIGPLSPRVSKPLGGVTLLSNDIEELAKRNVELSEAVLREQHLRQKRSEETSTSHRNGNGCHKSHDDDNCQALLDCETKLTQSKKEKAKSKSKSKVDHDRHVKDRTFAPGTPVWVRNERNMECREGAIERQTATHSYEVVVDGETEKKHTDQLQECIGEEHKEPTAEMVGEDGQKAHPQETPGPVCSPETPAPKPVLRRSTREKKPVEHYGYDPPVVKKISKRKKKKSQ